MKIQGDELISQMQTMMREVRSANGLDHLQTKELNPEAVAPSDKTEFSALLKNAIDTVNGLQSKAGDAATAFEMGDRSVTVGDVMIAKEKASVAFETTVQVRNKMIDAYKEIMQMTI